MKAPGKAMILASYLFIAAALSCEIEDDFPNQKPSEKLGGKFVPCKDVFGLYWSTSNEIITLGLDGLKAIDVDTKQVRSVWFDINGILTAMTSGPAGTSTWIEQYTWLHGDVLYFMQYGYLSAVDVTTMTYKNALLDSINIQVFSSPFSDSHIAYQKYTNDIDPPIFIYDIKNRTETFATTGQPCVFSPDGKQLLFTQGAQYFTYELDTKKITPLNFYQNYGSDVVRWTSEGILSFKSGYMSFVVTNETTGQKIGEWPALDLPTISCVSPSGSLLMTTKYRCANGSMGNDCAYQASMIYSVVDLATKEENEVAETTGYVIYHKALSPDQKKIALIGRDNYIYIAENLN